MAEMCEGVFSDSDWEFVEPLSFSFSRKRSIVGAKNQGGMDASKSASDIQEKDDAAYATANSVFFRWMKACGKRICMQAQRSTFRAEISSYRTFLFSD